jgi:prepilin-type N-terminal cleavage/methylation domain-containing protein
MGIEDMTTKGTTNMIERYRRIQREIQDEQGDGGEGGFTLIELLIVIVVLGILAAVTVFGLSNVTGQSVTSACKADARSVSVAVEAYKAQTALTGPITYPANVAALVPVYLRSDPSSATAPNHSHYTITTNGQGDVFVNPGGGTTALFFDGPNPPVNPPGAAACDTLP